MKMTRTNIREPPGRDRPTHLNSVHPPWKLLEIICPFLVAGGVFLRPFWDCRKSGVQCVMIFIVNTYVLAVNFGTYANIVRIFPLFLEEVRVGVTAKTNWTAIALMAQYLWSAVHLSLMTILFSLKLPAFLDRIKQVCTVQRNAASACLVYLIMAEVMLFLGGYFAYSMRKSFQPLAAGEEMSFISFSRLYPLESGTLAGGSFAVAYIIFAIAIHLAIFSSTLFLMVIVHTLGKEFDHLNDEIKKVFVDDYGVQEMTSRLEEIRLRHEVLSDVVIATDSFYGKLTLSGYLYGGGMVCFLLYLLQQGNMHGEDLSFVISFFIEIACVLLGFTVSGIYISEKISSARDILLKARVKNGTPEYFQSVWLFLERTKDCPAGISVLSMFMIDKVSAMTMAGTIATYAVLVLQLTPVTPAAMCEVIGNNRTC